MYNDDKYYSLYMKLTSLTEPSRIINAEIMFDLFAKPVGVHIDGGLCSYLWPEDNPSWSFGLRFPGRDRKWFDNRTEKIRCLLNGMARLFK